MPSSKGNPTDPELREKIKEGGFPKTPTLSRTVALCLRVAAPADCFSVPSPPDIKQEPNKSGGGEGQWSAWKANKLAKEYEKQGGDYENEPGSKNEPRKGDPQHKSESKKKAEVDE